MDDGSQIGRINMHLESISYWSSIYESGASSELVELQDQLYDLQLELQAAAAVLPVLQHETQPQDVVSGAEPLSAIPNLSGKIDDFGNHKVPRLQQLMQVLSRPITPEQLDEILPILKSFPPLINEFLKKRRSMAKQQRQQVWRQLQQQQKKQSQSSMGGIDGQLPGQLVLSDDPENPGARKLSIRRCFKQLVRTYRCSDVRCRLAICQSMKRVAHIKSCKSRINEDCQICRQELEQLAVALMDPNTPENQKQILQMLKKKPHLMADAIKDRENFNLSLNWLIGLDLEAGPSPINTNQVNTQVCNGANSGLESCQKVNTLVAHVKSCKKVMDSYCLACRRLRNFYGHHALICQVQDNTCPMPFCFNVKRRLNELPECRKSLQIRLLRRNRYLWGAS